MSAAPFLSSPKTPHRAASASSVQLTPETDREREPEFSPNSTLSFTGSTPSRVDASRTFLRNLSATPARKPLVRADPTLLTCFDPADKELYDLWAPKR